MISTGKVFTIIRNFLFSRTNREFLIFLFFLALSAVFWLMLTLNETYEQEVEVPVRMSNVPSDIMLTSEETDTIRVVIRDRGVTLLSYIYGDALRKVEADFKSYDLSGGTGTIPATELAKIVQNHLAASSKIVSIKPDKLHYYYTSGSFKRIPVRWRGRVIPEHLYFLSHVSYEPDSVTVYASEERLDSITMAYTETLNHVGFRDTLAIDCKLRKLEGVKIVPDHVKTTFYTDVLTEESIDDIPIEGINLPPNMTLRTFPAKVSVKFVTGVNVYRTLSAKDFTVVADYDELRDQQTEKCNLYLQKVPQGITRATLVTKQVDYLIEKTTP